MEPGAAASALADQVPPELLTKVVSELVILLNREPELAEPSMRKKRLSEPYDNGDPVSVRKDSALQEAAAMGEQIQGYGIPGLDITEMAEAFLFGYSS